MRMSNRSCAVSLPLSCCFSAPRLAAGRSCRLTTTPELLDAVLDGPFLRGGVFSVLAIELSLEAGGGPRPAHRLQQATMTTSRLPGPAACRHTDRDDRVVGRWSPCPTAADGLGPVRVAIGPRLRGMLEQSEVHAGGGLRRRDQPALALGNADRSLGVARHQPKRSTAQRIFRFMKCWIVSSAVRSASHGPTPRLAETGGATKIAVASASTGGAEDAGSHGRRR